MSDKTAPALGDADWTGFRIAEVDGEKKLYQIVEGRSYALKLPDGYKNKDAGYYDAEFEFIRATVKD